MKRALWPIALAAAIGAGGAAARVGGHSASVQVSAGPEVERVLRSAPTGMTVRLQPGRYPSFEVSRTLTIVGGPGVVVQGPITITADRVVLRDLVVVGGDSGIVVRDADRVLLDGVTVRGARLHGIEVAPGSAVVRDCDVSQLVSPYAQGFEVRNSSGRPRTVVEGCTVSSGQEGLVSHVSRVEFRDNLVMGTSKRAIVITEMSEGIAEGNEVRGVSGSGLYCGDMSHCEFVGNAVNGVAANPGVRSEAGFGAVGFYHSAVLLRDNRFSGLAAPDPVRLAINTERVDRSPLGIWPTGWRGAVPAVWVAGVALAGLGLVRVGTGVVVRRPRRARPSPQARTATRGVLAAVAIGFAVQSFHMLEHAVQVVQVYVADAEIRSGLAGQVVDTEWVHFTYNLAVLAFLGSLWAMVRTLPGWTGPRARPAAGWLVAALVIQTYHLAEHVAKIVQHLRTGVDPAPGLLGDDVGLVWFHFGINLAVYAGLAVAFTALLRDRERAAVRFPDVERGPVAGAPFQPSP